MEYNEKFMKEAIKQAKKAAELGETPVGAVIVRNGEIIARGRNKRENKRNCLCHAELDAINKACKKLGGWRLPACDLYVTLEPCPMCSGAVIAARIDNVYFGAYDSKAGCAGSRVNLFESGLFNYDVNVYGGKMERECADILSTFFKRLRIEKKEQKSK